jgi:hypothetical protein
VRAQDIEDLEQKFYVSMNMDITEICPGEGIKNTRRL